MGADTLVDQMHLTAGALFCGACLQRQDLVLELSGLRGCGGTLVTLQRIFVEHLARQAVLARHHFSSRELRKLRAEARDNRRTHVRAHAIALRQRSGGEHRHPRHAFDTSGNYRVHRV